MKRWPIVIAMLGVAGPALARDSLGVFDDWAAFRDSAAPRCYAIAQPESSSAAGIYATVGFWPTARVRSQIYIRLPRSTATVASVSLIVGDRRFPMTARAGGAWATDARGDAAIVAAIRGATAMRFEGGGFSARWRLHGAATAIDAAALGCARRG